MNQDKEKQYREEFEGWYLSQKDIFAINSHVKERYCKLYLAGRKKGDEENSLARASAHLRGETVLLQAEEIAQLKAKVEELKEQLKREAEFVNKIASNGLDVPVTVELMKRARSVQEQRKVL